MSLLFRHLAESFRKPDHWLYASWLDVITKYRKNALGLFWIFFPPIVYIWGLGAFMGAIQGKQMGSFLAHIGFGFMLFRLMSTMIIEAGATFAAHLPYIHDGNLRLTDYVLRTLSKALIHFLFAVPLLALVLIGDASVSPLGLLSSAAGLLVVVVNLLFFGVLVALAGARYPDINDFFGSVMLAVFLITPIVWLAEAAPADTLQGMLMRANPFHHMLAVVRGPILGEVVEKTTYIYVSTMTVIGLVLSTIFYSRFARRVPIWL